MSRMRILILILAASCGACAAPFSGAVAPGESEPGKTIYRVSHGWHAGRVSQRAHIPAALWQAPAGGVDRHCL